MAEAKHNVTMPKDYAAGSPELLTLQGLNSMMAPYVWR